MSQIFSYPTGSFSPDIKKIVPDVGPAVTPDITGTINIIGGDNITTDGFIANTLEISVNGTTNHAVQIGNPLGSLDSLAIGTDGQILVGSTGDDPAFATLTSTGSTIVFTPGANTLNLETGASVAVSFAGDSGTATPALGVLTIAGGTNLVSSAAGSTVTLDLNGTTDHAVQIGNVGGSISSLGVGTNGQVLLGATGADPAFATLTSPNGTIDLTAGVNSLALDANASLQITTGFATWGGAGNYFDDTTLGSFTVLRPGTGYIHSKLVSWAAPQTIAGMTAGNTYYIYMDNTGTIGKTATLTDATYADNIVLFECLRDSTPVTNNQITVKENHPFQFPEKTSFYLHEVVGTVIENNNNGANITLNGTQKIQINGADVLADHGLETTIPDSGGVGVTWHKMYTTAGGKWATYNVNDTFLGFYNNAGTPTALTAAHYAVYTLYVSKDTLTSTTPSYFAVLDTAQYTSLTLANNAISNGTTAKISNELAQLEICQLGYIIYRQATSSIVQVTISKATLKQTLSTGGTNTASLVNTVTTNFDGILSAADTNVQAALETIDDWGKSATNHGILIGRGVNTPIVAATLTDGQLLIGKTGAFDPVAASLSAGANISITPGAGTITIAATGGASLAWTAVTVDGGLTVNTGTIANKAGLLTMTLPATAALGDILEFTNINTAVGLRIAQNALQDIQLSGSASTIGITGYVETTQLGDSLKLLCTVAGASTRWQTLSIVGNWTVA